MQGGLSLPRTPKLLRSRFFSTCFSSPSCFSWQYALREFCFLVRSSRSVCESLGFLICLSQLRLRHSCGCCLFPLCHLDSIAYTCCWLDAPLQCCNKVKWHFAAYRQTVFFPFLFSLAYWSAVSSSTACLCVCPFSSCCTLSSQSQGALQSFEHGTIDLAMFMTWLLFAGDIQ